MKLIMYSTQGCHLCELAEGLLRQTSRKCEVEIIDIALSPELVECYGVRIPVIKAVSGAEELGWPFDLDELNRFLGL